MLATLGFDDPRRSDRPGDGPGDDPHRRGRSRCRRADARGRGARGAARQGRSQRGADVVDRLRLHDTITPPVILRNVLENPAWYTAYTPYQPEISPGPARGAAQLPDDGVRTSAGMDIANASLLDEGDRGRRGDGDAAPRAARSRAHRASSSIRGAIRRRSRSCACGPSRSGIEVVVADPATADSRRRVRRARAVPRHRRRDRRRSTPIVAARARRRRAGRGRGGRARARAACNRRARPAPTASSDRRSDSVCPSASAARTPRSWPSRDAYKRSLPGRLVGVSVDASGRTALSARAADARAAHPPREGDVEHLHRAGAAVGDGVAVRVVPRARRACARSPSACIGSPRSSRRACATAVSTSSTSPFFDTVWVRVPGRAARWSPRRASAGINLRVGRRGHGRHRARRDHHARDRRSRVGGVRRAAHRSTSSTRRAADGIPVGAAARRRDPHASGVPPLPQRARDAALPAAAGRQGPRARSHDDPARLVHDEAQRHERDDPGDVARVRRRSTRSRRIDQAQGYLEMITRARGDARRDHRLRRGVAAAERRLAGRVRRAARDPRVSPLARRLAARRVPHPVVGARHERRERRDGRHASGGRRVRRRRQRRSSTISKRRPTSTATRSPRSW